MTFKICTYCNLLKDKALSCLHFYVLFLNFSAEKNINFWLSLTFLKLFLERTLGLMNETDYFIHFYMTFANTEIDKWILIILIGLHSKPLEGFPGRHSLRSFKIPSLGAMDRQFL